MIDLPDLQADIERARARRVAAIIVRELRGAVAGHCVRVNYLDRDESNRVSQRLQSSGSSAGVQLQSYILVPPGDHNAGPRGLTADRAIELRNRKRAVLCLFVPADVVDATASSLGNSFAEIDGRRLYQQARELALEALGAPANQLARRVLTEMRNSTISELEMLDFVLATEAHANNGTLELVGLELWRVGLIADARASFTDWLTANRRAMRLLAYPQRLAASFRDRIASVKTTAATARDLELFFNRRGLHDVRAWSRDLALGRGPTFDRWTFPQLVHTNLESVYVQPFTDAHGVVVKSTKLLQPDGPGGTLLAPFGPKEALSVGWATEPLKPINVHAWQVALIPADSGDGDETLYDLPSREVKGTARTARLKLDLDLDEPLETSLAVRVVALDETGNEVLTGDSESIFALSDEFYLTSETRDLKKNHTQHRQTVATLAEGRLRAALDSRDESLTLTQPTWSAGDTVAYFSARVNERIILNIAASPLLLQVERRTIARSRQGGRWSISLDEMRQASDDDLQEGPPITAEGQIWNDFWKQRSGFFERLAKMAPRDVVEAADWTSELRNAAVRYAGAYTTLLDSVTDAELHDALSIDVLVMRVTTGLEPEEGLVVLPTHPIRALWCAAHAALLSGWEDGLLRHRRGERRSLVDVDVLRELQPANMPVFSHGWHDRAPFVFFQNLGFFNAVALPPGASDPLRRYRNIADVLGMSVDISQRDDSRPERLARHLREFLDVHPYADPLRLSLVNPDQGDFIASALEGLLPKSALVTDEDDEPLTLPAIDLTAYIVEDSIGHLRGLERLRARQHERRTHYESDHLRPGLSTTVRSLSPLANDNKPIAETHIAIVTDLSQPTVLTLPEEEPSLGWGSVSFYSLIHRFVSSFESDRDHIAWRYRVLPGGRQEPHPDGPRFSDGLTETQTALLRGTGRLINGGTESSTTPALEARLDQERVTLLERLHHAADWVITSDRFFGVDYYDSPRDPNVSEVADKYLVDHSPEFTEGLGPRMVVTTSRRDEIEAIFRRAMNELGFAAEDDNVRQLLHFLKTVSGRLALQALSPESGGPAAVSLGAVTAWLASRGRLRQGVLVPVGAHLDLFPPRARGTSMGRHRDGDLMLITLRRGIVEATFIEVKWRRGTLRNIDDVAQDMGEQLRMTGKAVEERYFTSDRFDGPLQRAHLAHVLRFYGARAHRYELLEPDAFSAFLMHLGQLEKGNIDFRPRYEGFIIGLEHAGKRQVVLNDLTVTILTSRDFADARLGSPLASGPHEDARPLDGVSAANVVVPEMVEAVAERDVPPGVPLHEDLPTVDLRGNNGSSAPPEPAAQATAEPIQVTLGDSGSKEVIWSPAVQGSPHLFITGIPGQGKSHAVLRLLLELSRQDVPAVTFDFHGQLGAPDSVYVQRSRVPVVDAVAGLPFSPFECSSDSSATGWNATAYAVAEIFDYVCGLGHVQRDTLFTCIRDAYRAHGFGTESGETPQDYPSLESVRRRIERAEEQKRTQNLIARCRPLLEMDIFRPPVGELNDAIDVIRRGLVVDLHRLASETLQLAAGAFLLRKIYRDMFSWDQASRPQLAVVLDEAHRLARDVTIPKIMKEGRKFGVVVILASQGVADFHADVVGNAGTKIAFRANYPESRKIAGFFRGRHGQDLPGMLEGLAVGEALVQTSEMQQAVRTKFRIPE